mmetsp:Transcript_67303/g.133369  ORF Transcript_67303/g.133369 Transcript_67303/m.133369 type:complete len:206 (+) Transcript_67303:593-1210(+)
MMTLSTWSSPFVLAVTWPSSFRSSTQRLRRRRTGSSRPLRMASSNFMRRRWRAVCRPYTMPVTSTVISSRRTFFWTAKGRSASPIWVSPRTSPRAPSSSAQGHVASGRQRPLRRSRTPLSPTGGPLASRCTASFLTSCRSRGKATRRRMRPPSRPSSSTPTASPTICRRSSARCALRTRPSALAPMAASRRSRSTPTSVASIGCS